MINVDTVQYLFQSFNFSYTQKPKPASFGLASGIYKPRPRKARPKPGLSGQAQAGTSLIVAR
jgi:hypothetical protein